MLLDEKMADFYGEYLPGSVVEGTTLTADCPFCLGRGRNEVGTMVVSLNGDGYFAGFFRCLSRCVAGGFAPQFARLKGLEPDTVPGVEPERTPYIIDTDLPLNNINQDIHKYQASLTGKMINHFAEVGISEATLNEMSIGFNGRYIVYPYFQNNNCCYAARCLSPDSSGERFWHGDEDFSRDGKQIFNVADIDNCEDGALFIVVGEENLLTLRELGFPGIAVPSAADLASIDARRFGHIKTVFLVVNNSPEADLAATSFAVKLGFKVRLFRWAADLPRDFNLADLARRDIGNFGKEIGRMINAARAFSPFATPRREYHGFLDNIERQQSESYLALHTGLAAFDRAVGGVHGINIIGGAPKAGKSCLGIQLATDMAAKKVPVIYYDFENGRQKIYQRTLSRLSRIAVARFVDGDLDAEELTRLAAAKKNLEKMLTYFRVVNDRKLTPEIMRRHVDFLRHETRRDDAVVVIDSLHKLPFKDFGEKRAGIDAWLRELEAIRDELNVAFIVLSELSRQDKGRYDGVPHMGLFKASGDIEYTADNAFVFLPDWDAVDITEESERVNSLWLVASREYSPGLVAKYRLDFPYWGFAEQGVE